MERALPSLKHIVDAVAWRATRHAGIYWFPLMTDRGSGRSPEASTEADGELGDDWVALIRMDPGCGYPPHRHVGVEDVLVLQGAYKDQMGEHHAGTYVRYPAGSSHAPVATGNRERPIGEENPSCVLFAIARSGVENL